MGSSPTPGALRLVTLAQCKPHWVSEAKGGELVEPRMYLVYLLQCRDGSIYTGITTDVARRFAEHLNGSGGHYTRTKGAEMIIYTEEHSDRSTALKRELQIEGWTRKKKLNLARPETRNNSSASK